MSSEHCSWVNPYTYAKSCAYYVGLILGGQRAIGMRKNSKLPLTFYVYGNTCQKENMSYEEFALLKAGQPVALKENIQIMFKNFFLANDFLLKNILPLITENNSYSVLRGFYL